MSVRIGVRDLRGRLSYWLGQAAAGEEIVVMRRGESIARITSVDGRTTLDQFVEQGLVTPAKRPKRPIRLDDLVPVEGSVSDLLLEDRKRGY